MNCSTQFVDEFAEFLGYRTIDLVFDHTLENELLHLLGFQQVVISHKAYVIYNSPK